jgi:hypothetical protein
VPGPRTVTAIFELGMPAYGSLRLLYHRSEELRVAVYALVLDI